ncbi:MAG: DUF3179 domain-containing protein [Myxococcales bacterium]|nr:DUF3179 domain-containing protein [Myxococcales bacterium]MDH3842689.1 DUF3179 domain-containing protein [Myxococcales bacterium]
MKRILLLLVCAIFVVACRDGSCSKRDGGRQNYSWQLFRRTWGLPLNNPGMIPGTEASFMKDDDLVIGTLIDDRARAYPWWLLRAYHIVNDTVCSDAPPGVYGKEKDIPCIPVLVTFCEACSGSAVFEAVARFRGDESEPAGGPMLTFFMCGVAKGSWIGCDRETNSRWYPFLGAAHEGKLEGARMKRLPSFLTTWNDWLTQHPETLVTTGSAEIRARPHGHANAGPVAGAIDGYELSENPLLDWMSPWEMVYGLIPPVEDGEAIRPVAYPLEYLRDRGGLVQTEFAGLPIVLITRNRFHVVGFDRRVGGRVLNFDWDEEDEQLHLADQDGNRWTAYGTGASNANKGQRLNIIDGYITEWYEWAEKFKDTELAGH